MFFTPFSVFSGASSIMGGLANTINMLASGRDISGAGWNVTGVTFGAGSVPPDAGPSKSMTDTLTSGIHGINQSFSRGSNAPIVFRGAVVARYTGTMQRIYLTIDEGVGTNGVGCTYDLYGARLGIPAASFGTGWVATNTPGSIQSLGNNWFLCTLDVISPSGVVYGIRLRMGLDANVGTGGSNQSYTGTGIGVDVAAVSLLPLGAWANFTDTFFDDFADISTIDINDTRAPGFKWYTHSTWPNVSWHDLASGGITDTMSPTPPSEISVANSVVTLTTDEGGKNLGIQTAASVNTPPYYVGTVFPAPLYMEALASYDPSIRNGSNYSWPSVYSIDIDVQTGTGNKLHGVELDVFEAGMTGLPLETIHDWIFNTSGVPTQNDYFSKNYSENALFHRLGMLVLTQSYGGLGQGYIMFFRDGVWLQGDDIAYSVLSATNPAIGGHSGNFSLIDFKQWPIFIHAGSTTSSFHGVPAGNWPINVDYVRVLNAPLYTGPGDVVTGAVGWWGLRAYSSATVGAKCIRIKRASDSAQQDFNTLANGLLDVVSIATFLTSTTGTIVVLYDQSGNHRDLTVNAAGTFNFTFGNFTVPAGNGLGALPACQFNDNVNNFATSPSFGLAQPMTISAVALSQAVGGSHGLLSDPGAVEVVLGTNLVSVANNWNLYAGSTIQNSSVPDNVVHSCQAVINGANSALIIDGVTTAGNAGNSTLTNGIVLGYTGGQGFQGMVMEIGLWGVAFSAATAGAVGFNQRSFWGF